MPTRRGRFALDWINFFLADVETGVGPFMATYYASVRHWNPAQVGIILATQKIASVVAQTPAGWIIDRSNVKSWLMAGSSLAIGLGAFLIAAIPSVNGQVINQVGVGFSTALATPLLAAISLGMVGRQLLSRRIGRNEAFNHAGNFVTASLAGLLGYAAGLQWIFYVCGGLGVVCAATSLLIRRGDIDDHVAREAPETGEAHARISGIGELLTRPLVLVFAAVVVLFHIANAAMLPLVGEVLPATAGRSSSVYMSACIIVAQLVMMPVSLISGRLAGRLGRKPILLAGFCALVLRGLLFSLSKNPHYLVTVETLDGLGTGVTGVLTVLIISDLAAGSGRFNLLQGVMQSCLSMGSFLGNLLAGLAAKRFGFSVTFVGLACVAGAGLLIFAFGMPETLNRRAEGVPVTST